MGSSKSYILAIDQGTSGTKTILFDGKGKVVSKVTEPLKTYFLKDGFVEQSPEDIYNNVLASIENCIKTYRSSGGDPADIKACGIANQRETFIIWDDKGEPLYNAVVWCCKRSIQICERLKSVGFEDQIRSKTGLIIDPYFSGTKLIWLYENIHAVRSAINKNNAYFGTIDTWLLYKLTKGKAFLTDYTNASRTLFFHLKNLQWDRELLEEFGLSKINLPEPKPSSYHFGETDFNGLMNNPIPVTAMIGDSQAAAFGEGCFSAGTAKATLGTGSSILMNIGSQGKASQHGMITTICWSTEKRVDYALEGAIVSCGSTIEWIKNQLGLIKDSKATEAMATSVDDNNGVYLIPAFSGLGAPHWNMNQKASITGLTFDCNKNHIVRAALESIAYQIKDVVVAMESDTNIELNELIVDGGMTSNGFVLQFLADLLDRPVVNIGIPEISALGAAYLAGLKVGVYKDLEQLKSFYVKRSVLQPVGQRMELMVWYREWQNIIEGTRQT